MDNIRLATNTIMLLLLVFTISVPAQTKKQPVTKSKAVAGNCGCDYFPLCKYDIAKSFKGDVWKGINGDDGKTTYYQCLNGVLKSKTEVTDNFSGDSWGYETVDELRYNQPKLYSWAATTDVKGNKFYYAFCIWDKYTNININGILYKDVIKVYRKKSGATFFYEGKPVSVVLISSEFVYYARGMGVIKREQTPEMSNPNVEVH